MSRSPPAPLKASKARGLPADEVFLDPEDAVAPAVESAARANAAEAEYSRVAAIIEAYSRATTVDRRDAVMLGDEMIDEASRTMAQAVLARGNAAGFARQEFPDSRRRILGLSNSCRYCG